MPFILYIIFVAFIFIKPFETIAPELAEYNPMVYFAIIIFFATAPRALYSKGRIITSLHVGCLTGLFFAIAVSWLAQGWLGGAGQSLLSSAPSFVLFLLTVLLVTSRERLNALVAAIVSLVTIIAAFAILDYHYSTFNDLFVMTQPGIAHDSSGIWPSTHSPSDLSNSIKRLRWVGELSDPNDLGQILIMALPLLMFFWRPKGFLRNLIVVALPAATLLYGVFLTQSRGALVGLAAVTGVFIYRRFGRIPSLVFLQIIVIAVFIIGGVGGREFSTSESSASGRLEAWSAGIEMLKSNPLTGVGFGAFLEHHNLTAHNSFVLVFAELGLIGYFFWFGLIVAATMELRNGFRARIKSEPLSYGLVSIAQSFVGYFVCAWFLSRSYSNIFFLLIGMTICAGRLAYLQGFPAERIDTGRWLRLTMAYSLLSIAFVYLFLIVNNLMSK